MINGDGRGHSYFIVGGEILGFMKDEQAAKAFAKDVFINQERKLGARRRSDTVLVSTINDADRGSADIIAIVGLQRGIPSKRESSARVDYVPPFVHTRRSYRLNDPVKCSDRGGAGGSLPRRCEKSIEPYHLEEGEVVTRFP
ncbi:hypothetical protein RND71_019103 [Anisodus tanguticus]|uniref:Uncharacterized protein n=1 Tax=Anisodus tanguticus TaxID=243964 RepID=A0AAE1RYG9_9SOLA|nr:hypothetical protein RND71_019103 [Anisodus tanguticus]